MSGFGDRSEVRDGDDTASLAVRPLGLDGLGRRRRARRWMGRTAVFGAASSVVASVLAPWAAPWVLAGGWGAAAGAYLLGRYGTRRPRWAPSPRPAVQLVDMAILDEGKRASLSAPLMGMALLGPLTVQLVVLKLLAGTGSIWVAPPFGAVLLPLSLLNVFGTISLLKSSDRFARDLREGRAGGAPGVEAATRAFLASLFPGLLLLGLPSVFFGAAALAVVPYTFGKLREAYEDERDAVDAHQRRLVAERAQAAQREAQTVLEHPCCPPEVAATVIRFLIERFSKKAWAPALDRLCLAPRDDTAATALRTALRIGHPPPPETLKTLVRRGAPGVSAVALELYLKKPRPGQEDFLLSMLEQENLHLHWERALEALSEVGTARALPRLEHFIAAHLPAGQFPASVAYGVRDTILERLPAGSVGQLSLAGYDRDGAVSVIP